MEPEEFLTKIALQVREIVSQKGERENFKPNDRGLVFSKGAVAPLQVPPDILKVHKLFQEKFKTTYLREGKIDNQNDGDFKQVADAVVNILQNAQPKKSAGFGASLTVGASANKRIDDAYNAIVQLKSQYDNVSSPDKPKPQTR